MTRILSLRQMNQEHVAAQNNKIPSIGEEATDALKICFAGHQKLPHVDGLFTWLVETGDDIVDLLRQYEPMPLTILLFSALWLLPGQTGGSSAILDQS
jgi:hypothetical protein